MTMQAPATLPKISVEQLVERIFAFRQITRLDQRLLMSTLLSKEALSHEDYIQINRVLDGVQKGLLKVVD